MLKPKDRMGKSGSVEEIGFGLAEKDKECRQRRRGGGKAEGEQSGLEWEGGMEG